MPALWQGNEINKYTHTHTHTRTLILHAYQIEKMGGEKIRIYFVVQSLDLHPWGKNKNMVSRRMQKFSPIQVDK